MTAFDRAWDIAKKDDDYSKFGEKFAEKMTPGSSYGKEFINKYLTHFLMKIVFCKKLIFAEAVSNVSRYPVRTISSIRAP